MLKQRPLRARPVVEGHRLVQNAAVARFAQIGGGAGDEPQRVVVKAGAHVGVASFGQRLVLVVGAAVLKLNGGNVENAPARAVGDQMNESEQILAAVAKAHAAPGSALKIAGAAAHVERDHALVLVPHVHHAVQPVVFALEGKAA